MRVANPNKMVGSPEDILRKHAAAINTIEFGDLTHEENIVCDMVIVSADTKDEGCSASHRLNRVPVGTIVMWMDKASIMYKPTEAASADTKTHVYFKFNTDATCAILLII